MGVIITTHADSFSIDLNGVSNDRKKARIKYSDIRSLVADKDEKCVELVFSSNEIYYLDYNSIDELDGTAPTDQDDLYSRLEAKIFAP